MELVPNGHMSRRVVFALMYLGYAGMGWFQFPVAAPSLSQALGGLYWVWAVLLLTGGFLGAAGAVTRYWVVEFAAQGPLAMPFAFWGWVLAHTDSPTRWIVVCWCWVMVCVAVVRAVDLWWLARHTRKTRSDR